MTLDGVKRWMYYNLTPIGREERFLRMLGKIREARGEVTAEWSAEASVEDLIDEVLSHPSDFEFFQKDLDERVKIAAVTVPGLRAGYLIRHIDNPSETVKFMSVKANPDSIMHIKDPSVELQMLAVTLDYRTLMYIEKPDPSVVAKAMEIDTGVK